MALRWRETDSGVSKSTATQGSPADSPLLAQPVAQVRVEAEGVDHHGETTPGPAGHDLVEQGEGVGRGVEVELATADHRPQGV